MAKVEKVNILYGGKLIPHWLENYGEEKTANVMLLKGFLEYLDINNTRPKMKDA